LVTRNDTYARFSKEDLAVGLDLFKTSCLMFVVLLTDKAIALRGHNAFLATPAADPNKLSFAKAPSRSSNVHLDTGKVKLESRDWFPARLIPARTRGNRLMTEPIERRGDRMNTVHFQRSRRLCLGRSVNRDGAEDAE
jgi:hypothetical protein